MQQKMSKVVFEVFRFVLFFFFNDTATTEIYTLSLHDALPISFRHFFKVEFEKRFHISRYCPRSEEHTSELQSLRHLVCRLLLEKKKKYQNGLRRYLRQPHATGLPSGRFAR